MSAPVTRDDVVRAAETIRGRVRRTPLVDGSALAPGLRLKAELLQHTGSFKARGVVNRLSALDVEERARGVAGASAGNHAIALSWGAAAEGLECTVFSWASASPFKLDRARALGATIDMGAADPAGAFERLEEHLAATGSVDALRWIVGRAVRPHWLLRTPRLDERWPLLSHAVAGLAAHWATHPEAARVLALAVRSADPSLRGAVAVRGAA